MVDEVRNVRRTVLPNGLTIISEQMEHIRSVSLGIWVKSGSRHEAPEANGITHFIEHMVFKGTATRSAQDIARQIDCIGGNMDAFTAKECICFTVKVLDEHLPTALEVLSDLVLHPVFDPVEIVRERGVILEEIKMDEDSPDYLVHEIFTQNFWKDHPLGKPILGTKETVKRFEQPLVIDYWSKHFHPGSLIVCGAGHLNHDTFVEQVCRHLEGLPASSEKLSEQPPKVRPRIIIRNKKALEQVQICLGVPSHPINHERRYASYILNTLLGGGMSSRLFQNIREQQGLAYAIYTELNPYRDTGCLSVYAGTSRESALKVVQLILKEFHELKAGSVSAEELNRAKEQLKGSLMLSLESSGARMSNLGRQEMYFGQFITLDEIIQNIDGVTTEDLTDLANEFFRPETIAVTVLGNLNGFKLTRDQIAC
jgi:predicted Zn-dependent peptidase